MSSGSSAANRRFIVHPDAHLRGSLQVPGDKSISHRSIMLAALAEGVSRVDGFLDGADCLATLAAFRAMGVNIEKPGKRQLLIHGVGMHGLRAPAAPLDLGNSGTSMRLLSGLLAGQRFDCELGGDVSLSQRPMRRVTEPLALMGAKIDTGADGTAPLFIHGNSPLRGMLHQTAMASAQVKSALLLAGLYAEGETRVREPGFSRDHTERMLQGFGYSVEQHPREAALCGGGRLQATNIAVPGDLSSAAFFLVGASISPGSDVLLSNVGVNPTRTGILKILELMGADIDVQNLRDVGGEPVADLRVRSADLQGIEIPPDLVPLAIDEFPAIFIAAACADGETMLGGAAELRVKESDRIAVMAEGLRRLGIEAEPHDDGIRIVGGDLQAGAVEAHGDHRIAMAFAMAGLRAAGPVQINDCANVDTSFPDFAQLAASAGLDIRVEDVA